MLLDDIVDYLTSGGISNLYKGFMPATPDAPESAVAVYEYSGRPSVHTMAASAGQAVVEYPRVQVVCRGGEYDYAAARNTAHSVFKLLDGMPTRLINGVAYKAAFGQGSPAPMGRDDKGRVLIACNYEVIKELST